jgi:hypothetical protein
MRDFILSVISLLLCIVAIKIIMMDIRIRNIEQTVNRCESGYHAVVTENEKLVRVTDQTLQIMLQGGWDDFTNIDGGSTSY